MHLFHGDITIRNAVPSDAALLCSWWNDGEVMAHAGFPNGLGITEEKVIRQIEAETDDTTRRHIILYKDVPIGEMNYRQKDEATCEMGIKICVKDMQEKGLGRVILSVFITGLFKERGYKKIVLDTNLTNKRAQHVYEKLGFSKLRVNYDSWTDQLGRKQSSVDYELTEEEFIPYI